MANPELNEFAEIETKMFCEALASIEALLDSPRRVENGPLQDDIVYILGVRTGLKFRERLIAAAKQVYEQMLRTA